jgi:DNA-binding NtrC family response regulator
MEKTAFIVDDDESYRQYITTFLSHFKYNVKGYGNGKDCLANLSLDPSFIILDHNLENDEDGLELLRLIKTQKPSIPIIYLSGQQNVTKAVQALKLGSMEYIEKNGGTLIHLKSIVEQFEGKKKKGIAGWFA